jgi:hypothetical protein
MLQRLSRRQNLHIDKIQRALQVRQNFSQRIRLYEWQLALERRLGAKLGNPFLFVFIKIKIKIKSKRIVQYAP